MDGLRTYEVGDGDRSITNTPIAPDEPGERWRFLHEHLYRAKLISYSLLLIVGVSQIVLRENFPQIKIRWSVIGSILIVVLLGIVLIPPIKHFVQHSKRP
jgi:uncharacterized membrane protein YagU involved in acid resistance